MKNLLSFLIMTLLALPSFVYAQKQSDDKKIDYRPLTQEEEITIKAWVSNGLKDGESAKFKLSERVISINNEPEYIYCGLVNAKNSYGAYSGWVVFKSFVTKNAYNKLIALTDVGQKKGVEPAMQIGDGKFYEQVLFDTCTSKGYFKGNYLNEDLIGRK
ncbi:hypothetical protein [Proteus sp. FME41]|uniref:hypothetical protein n=1 Tax=Proteus sp. FME41 TaxID=2742608 RepID=UPI001866CA2B|nr:hypothetical protein [Proteus sp. FME41]